MEELLKVVMSNLGLIIGALLVCLALFSAARYATSRYKRVPPSRVGIIYGRKNTYEVTGADGTKKKEELGFRLLTGGGALVWPFFEDYSELRLDARLIPLEVKDIPTEGGVMVNARGTATVVIGSDMATLIAAVRTFEGKKDEDINTIIRENLEGQLRSILGTLTIENLIGNRESLNRAVLSGAETELLKIGVRVTILTIQQISDTSGYIESLGKRRTAEVKRDAQIGEAEATRDADIAASNAKKEAELVAAQNAVAVAQAQKERDVQVAQFKALTDRERAIAEQAGAIATAERDKEVRQKRVEALAAETESKIRLAEQETLRVEKELQFQVIKPAEAERESAIIKAEAERKTQVISAEAEKSKQIIQAEAAFEAAAKQAQAIKTKAEADAEATAKRGQGDADATRARLTAEADGEKAKRLAAAAGVEAELVANATGKEAELMAEAKGAEAKLLAEAKGKEQLAKALAQLDQTGKLLQVLDAAPRVAESLGDALAKALGPQGLANVFGQMAAPLSSVDSIRMYDFGGNSNGSGSGALNKFANLTPEMFFNVIAKAKALGFGNLLEKIGVTSEILDGMSVKDDDKKKEEQEVATE